MTPRHAKFEEQLEKLSRKVRRRTEKIQGEQRVAERREHRKRKLSWHLPPVTSAASPESLLSHDRASYCFKAAISRVAGVSRHGKRRDTLAREMGIVSFLPKYERCWNKAKAETEGKHGCLPALSMDALAAGQNTKKGCVERWVSRSFSNWSRFQKVK